MSFYEWLQNKYSGKDIPRGDLADDAKHDSSFPQDSCDRETILWHLQQKNACAECIALFKRAFRDYEKSCKA